MKTIAAFDFDGTLIKVDSLHLFLKESYGLKKYWFNFLIHLPLFVMVLLKIKEAGSVKERFIGSFTKNQSSDLFLHLCNQFSHSINKNISQRAFKKLEWHKSKGHIVTIISASAENWIDPWAKQFGLETIATKLEVKNGNLTGRFSSANCKGKEKVKRLISMYPKRESYILYAYGDSSSDKALLDYADYSFFKSF